MNTGTMQYLTCIASEDKCNWYLSLKKEFNVIGQCKVIHISSILNLVV